jgi:ketosteroid isomerase-like protein
MRVYVLAYNGGWIMSMESVAKRLVELCRDGKFEQAQDELYAKDAESTEPDGTPQAGTVKGLDAIKQKGRRFQESTEAVHAMTVGEPTIAGNWFSVAMTMDITMKQYGRMTMTEICVYHVKDGKIDKELFFYDAG